MRAHARGESTWQNEVLFEIRRLRLAGRREVATSTAVRYMLACHKNPRDRVVDDKMLISCMISCDMTKVKRVK